MTKFEENFWFFEPIWLHFKKFSGAFIQFLNIVKTAENFFGKRYKILTKFFKKAKFLVAVQKNVSIIVKEYQ